MKTLSKEEKEIIKLIQEREITDIYSYVKYYNLGVEVQQYKEDVEQRFNEAFNGKKYKCHISSTSDINAGNIIKRIDDKNVWATPKLSYFGCEGQNIKYEQEVEVIYGYFLFKPTYICEDMEKIFHFISVWQYLVSEGLVIELPKSCERNDMSLFLRKEKLKHETPPILETSNLSIDSMEVNASHFMDWKFVLDKLNFELCLPYLQKRLYPTLGLDTFIGKGFKTKADLNERRNFWIALLGVLFALITSAVSIIISIFDNGNAEELIKINNSLQEIREELELPEETTEAPLPTEETDSLEQAT